MSCDLPKIVEIQVPHYTKIEEFEILSLTKFNTNNE